MKLAEISVPLPLYRIESDVTYHTERKPTVFERMVLRLCDPGLHLPDKQNLSLLGVFRDQLGAGDVRELLESCVSELAVLGALPNLYAQDSIDMPLKGLELTDEGLQFLRSDSLPVRSRTVNIWHRYDPINDEVKPAKSDGTRFNQSELSRVSVADQFLRPKNPLTQVEHAIAQEVYDWKNPATVIDRIEPMVQFTGCRERVLKILCNEDGILSASAQHDSAFQLWLDKTQPEILWDILLADTLTIEPDSSFPELDSSLLKSARAVRPITTINNNVVRAGLRIVTEDVAEDVAVPTIVLSSDVSEPQLISSGRQLNVFTLRVPTPQGVMTGFRCLSLPQVAEASVQVEVAGNFRLYWAGQPRSCGLTVILNEHAGTALWAQMRKELERFCEGFDEPRIALMPVAWRSVDEFGETLFSWLAIRAKQPLGDLMTIVEPVKQAMGLWRSGKGDWKSVWEASMAKAIEESLKHTPNQLEAEEVSVLLTSIASVLSSAKVAPLHAALLRHVVPVRSQGSFAKLRSSLLAGTEIPEELISIELRRVWLEQVLSRQELNLYGPHGLEQPMQKIQSAVKNVYRSIGERALKMAGNRQIDARSLTPKALDAVETWRKTVAYYHDLNTPSPLWDEFNEAVECWNILAQEKLAPVEGGCRVVVFDTSALMETPEILQKVSPTDIPVVPHRVLSELDGLKSSEVEDRAFKAREAIRRLDKISIRYEAEHTDLLPAEWDAGQADDSILSTALFFRLNEVLFVSNDINLRNKAKSLGLKAQDSHLYISSGHGHAAGSDIQSRKPKKQKNIRK